MKESWPKAAEVLAAGGSAAEAARAAKVAPRTIRRWRADEVIFVDAIDASRTRMLGEAAGLLAAATTAAARRLAEIAEDSEPRYALPASRSILDLASRYRSDTELETRIAALEMAAGLRSDQAWP